MRKIILSLHSSLDGFVAGPNGEMDWIRVDDELFELVGKFTDEADTALYGRVTYQMMEAYWPMAGSKPDATKHDLKHSTWYSPVDKVVLSRTMTGTRDGKTRFISSNVPAEISRLKGKEGKNILIFGSPGAAHSLMEQNLIDEYRLFVNPVLLGQGIPVFEKISRRTDLKHMGTKVFPCGVTALHYSVKD